MKTLVDFIKNLKSFYQFYKDYKYNGANMDFDRKVDEYLPWCIEQKMKNGWNNYYFPKF